MLPRRYLLRPKPVQPSRPIPLTIYPIYHLTMISILHRRLPRSIFHTLLRLRQKNQMPSQDYNEVETWSDGPPEDFQHIKYKNIWARLPMEYLSFL